MSNIHNAKVADSTLDDVIAEGTNQVRRVLSRITIALVAAIVLIALFGVFDLESSTESSAGGIGVHIRHPTVARAGNEVELEVHISSSEPLPETLKLNLTEDYLLFFEDLAVFPDPEAQSADGFGTVEFEVAPQKDAAEMTVRITGRASDQWDLATHGNLAVQAGPTTVNVPLTTWRVP